MSNLRREKDGHRCWACGLEEDGNPHPVHHIIRYRWTQDNSLSNLWALCSRCHAKLEHFTAVEWDLIYKLTEWELKGERIEGTTSQQTLKEFYRRYQV